jgi:hypothetical protein
MESPGLKAENIPVYAMSQGWTYVVENDFPNNVNIGGKL